MSDPASEPKQLSERQLAFLDKYLDVRIDAGAGPATAQQGGKLLPIWRDARDETNGQLSQLQDAMQKSGVPLFARIADAGLNGITETRLVELQVGLMEVDAAKGETREKALAKARDAVGEMRNFLSTNPVLPLLEANPLKVTVTLRATLNTALDSIDKTLAA